MNHNELTFVEAPGRREFTKDVNQILQRGGTMYELNPAGRIVRIGTAEVQQVISQMTPASGDTELDGLLSLAKERYLSRQADDRALALEKLWDAFERLKTVPSQQLTEGKVMLGRSTVSELIPPATPLR